MQENNFTIPPELLEACTIKPEQLNAFKIETQEGRSMNEYKYEELEMINTLGDAKHCLDFMKAPDKELYFIYVNRHLFATFTDEINALIIHDMMHLHFNEYLHLYEAQEGET